MKGEPVIVFSNGIEHDPSSAESWNRRAQIYTTAESEFDAVPFLYSASWWGRRLTLNKRARELAELLYRFRDRELHFVGHSNGAEVFTRAVRYILQTPERFDEPLRIVSVHLCGPANDADFTKNWLNSALLNGLVYRVWVYCASNDSALWWGNATRKMFGWLGLGYGNLGRDGPQNVADGVHHRVETLRDVVPGHTDFFNGEHFKKTLASIYSHARIAAGRDWPDEKV